ncbi:MAG TPA: N-acetylmuramoyl-L-alanine amidase [Gemmatimonadaceae bacterium]
MRSLRYLPAVGVAMALGCATVRTAHHVPQPAIIPHAQWQSSPPLGYAADATRRNEPPGGTLVFHDLSITVLGTSTDSAGMTAGDGGTTTDTVAAAPSASADSSNTPHTDTVRLRLRAGDAQEERVAREGEAFNWHGYHIAIVAIYGKGELGGGLVALEAATLSSLPSVVASSRVAGGAELRLRVPHHITSITLHHEGSAEPLRPGDDPVKGLRALQSWGASDRDWWDVPYHFLIDLDGHIYEGRDWHYMGETNTTYDPHGHLLISILGNYNKQEPTQAQLNAIADLMAWAVDEFHVPLDSIRGHYQYAQTDCPGKNLRKYLEDGTFRRMVQARLREAR